MADDLVADGDPRRALERLWRRGFRTREGREVPGLRDLLQRLRRERQRVLEHHQLDGLLDDLKDAHDDILPPERSAIERRPDDARRSPAPDATERPHPLEA